MLNLIMRLTCVRQAQESRTGGPAAAAPKRSDLMSLLEINRGSLAGSSVGLGFRMALPKMPSFRVSVAIRTGLGSDHCFSFAYNIEVQIRRIFIVDS